MAEANVHDILKALKKLTPEQKQWLQETIATTPRAKADQSAHIDHHDEDEAEHTGDDSCEDDR